MTRQMSLMWMAGWLNLAMCAAAVQTGPPKQQRQEERLDYYHKWLRQDVAYIISDEEKAVFEKLSTAEEKDRFIEQFWLRRDPDPRSAINELKEEHYRRLSYVNERFGSGIPGWKTDRGRLYIALGPPDIIEDHPSGGFYYRPAHEGGGATSTYPFQIWTYNHIQGVGDQIEVEFVDPSWSGEYRMALEPWEKDALLHSGFSGATDAELEGGLSKLDRPYFSPGNARNTLMQSRLGMRSQDKPFQRLARFYQLQKPQPIEYTDLKKIVTSQVTYNQLPFRVGHDYLEVDEGRLLVPITLEFDNHDLTFEISDDGRRLSSRVDIYGLVQNLAGRFVTEFEDALLLEFPSSEQMTRLSRRSLFQRVLLLEPGRYKLTMVVRDPAGDKASTIDLGLVLPRGNAERLEASSVILARTLLFVEDPPDQAIPFLLGDFKVIPNIQRSFNRGDPMGLYMQVYNAGIDQADEGLQVEVEYQILQGERVVLSFLDPKKNSIVQYPDRLILLQAFNLKNLEPGSYVLKIEVNDPVRGQELSRRVDFTVTDSVGSGG